jgi:hypothetical protein
MGGKAFSNAHVPRMSPAVYQQVSTECQAKLETVFPKVVLPREAPGKADYGDIDFLVEGPTSLEDQVWIKAKEVLGAEFYLSNGNSHSFGVPHPERSDAHVQVDVELSPESGTAEGPELFEWTRFMKGDSDMMQIIGISHRNFGLTCTDKGLFVRLEQIEAYDHKKAKLFLTRDPDQAMDFYGLDKAKYWSGFKDEDDLFDWVTNGRFFSAAVFERREEGEEAYVLSFPGGIHVGSCGQERFERLDAARSSRRSPENIRQAGSVRRNDRGASIRRGRRDSTPTGQDCFTHREQNVQSFRLQGIKTLGRLR